MPSLRHLAGIGALVGIVVMGDCTKAAENDLNNQKARDLASQADDQAAQAVIAFCQSADPAAYALLSKRAKEGVAKTCPAAVPEKPSP